MTPSNQADTRQLARRIIESRNGNSATYPPAKVQNRFRFIDDEQIESLPPIEYLIDGLMPKKSLAEIHAPPGAGKSFIALDLSLSVASGQSWNGRQVVRGNVIYIAAEGSAGLPQRVAAWKHVGAAGQGPRGVWFCTQPLPLLDRAQVLEFAEAVRNMNNGGISLLVIDTFARCFAGGDENSSRDMGIAIDAADLLRSVLDCAVLIIHHTRKDGEVERGSTALRGALDVMMAVRMEGSGHITLSCEKMKDAAEFERIDLQLTPTLESCVVTAKSSWQYGGISVSQKGRQLLESLSRDFLDDGASASEWRKASDLPERTFYRERTSLVREGYVTQQRGSRFGRYTLTDTGKQAITANCQVTASVLPGSKEKLLPPSPTPLGGGSMAGSPESRDMVDIEL